MRTITSIDLFCIVRELQILKDARLEKVYQPSKTELLLVFYNHSFGKIFLRIISGVGVFLTKSKKDYANFPPHFCMFLRKHLRGAVVRAVKQRQDDRVLEIMFETKEGTRILIAELFGTGNVLLCETDYRIITVQQVQIFKDRKLLVHKMYEPPQQSISSISINSINFKRALASSAMNSVVKALAAGIGLGGKYAEEICLRAGVQKESSVLDISKESYDKLYNSLDALIRHLKYKNYSPQVILENGIPTDFTPIPFKIYEGKELKNTSSFNEALDEYYTHMIIESAVKSKRDVINKETSRLEAVKSRQEETISTYTEEASKNRIEASKLLSQVDTIETIRTAINTARDNGDTWQDIERKLENDREKQIPAALLVKRLDPEKKAVILNSEPEVSVNLYETAGKQISAVYDEAKKLEHKAETAKDYLLETEKKIEETSLITPHVSNFDIPHQAIRQESKSWFENFKYFHTSSGYLVICGKDADSNEQIIKRHMQDSDIIFHADIFGSPFGLLRANGSQTSQDLKEAAIFVGSHSRAWREGLGTADVYWVNSSQVAKEGGLQKGSFMIYGRRNYFYGLELALAVGILDGKIISGPVSAVESKTSRYVLIIPGQTSQHDFAKKLKEALNYSQSPDDFVTHIPSGNSDIKKVTMQNQTRTEEERKQEAGLIEKESAADSYGDEEEKHDFISERMEEEPVVRYGSVEDSPNPKEDENDFFFNGYDELNL